MTLLYPDCSNNNWSSTQDAIDFLEQLVPEGFSGMCHKVSEGNYYEDPYWPTVQQWCQQNSLPVIGYHYVTTDDPASQAQTWQGNNGGTVAMLDWEENGGDLSNLAAVVDAFDAAGITVQLGYYPQWYWSDQGGGDLSGLANALVSSAYPDGAGYASTIYANSGGNSGEGWAPYGDVTPSAWQFTNSADIAGFTVDCNAYQGTDITVLFGMAPMPATAPDTSSTTASLEAAPSLSALPVQKPQHRGGRRRASTATTK
ncbi:MAG TPA: GH25 family lysozyme [Mycobacterium sp.]|nr:GH25 family lysozyme [Mycobacterium sp.]HUH69426.1 GH25 family lysozyme [Mycobacterium sp.]